MNWIPLVLAIAALLVALAAFARAGSVSRLLEDGLSDAKRIARGGAEEAESQVEVLKRLLAKVAAGEHVDAGMIEEGRIWRDVTDAQGQELLASADDLFVLDVRTQGEASGGVIPGATLIPVDELEARVGEVPRSGKTLLVYCAAGARSAAACEFLASKGYGQLVNLESGFGGWSGPREPYSA